MYSARSRPDGTPPGPDEVTVVDDAGRHRVYACPVEHVHAQLMCHRVAAFDQAGHGQGQRSAADGGDGHIAVGQGGAQQVPLGLPTADLVG